MITGQYAHQHKVTSNDPPGTVNGKYEGQAFENGREQMNQFMDAQPTLPRMLGANGYVSLQTGKWWQGDYKRGGFTQGMTHGQRHGDDGLAIGRQTMQPIYDFIESAGKEKKPFMVWYAPMMPHRAHNPPKRILKKYLDKTDSEFVAKYWAMCEWFDETVGQLMKHLDEKGLSEDTIVVFMADNGWIQDPKRDDYAPKSKQSPNDGGLRTPIMVRWKGHVQPKMSDELAMSIDLTPTLLKACGLVPPAVMNGIDLLDEHAVTNRKAIFGECFTHTAVDLQKPAASVRYRWVIEGEWKLIQPDAKNEPKAVTELYHVSQDPREEKNLAANDAERVKSMQAKLDAWWNPAQN
jgi:uncharacterized sulfatase